MIALIARYWKLALVVAALAVLLGRLGYVEAQNVQLRERLATTVQVITAKDLALLQAQGTITRQQQNYQEVLTLLRQGVIERTTTRAPVPAPTSPATPPNRPTTAPQPSPGTRTPPLPPPTGALIPPAQAAAARGAASEAILVHFDAGHLIDCTAQDVPQDAVELLRDNDGVLLSTAPCVPRIDDTIHLPPPVVEKPPSPLVYRIGAGLVPGGIDWMGQIQYSISPSLFVQATVGVPTSGSRSVDWMIAGGVQW